ncbi:MAG TPA: HXXEE domain-containing protein [Longimicrobiaceae bacterium]|nr:HXXEE domain-containing protein [Longimicrobiaceae bacterium]
MRDRPGLAPAFLALVCVQALHSLEEYLGRLWESFPPARMVSGLFSSDLERGFVIFNLALVAFGFWCWLFPVRRGWASAAPLAWLWVGIELVNGIGHPAWSLLRGGYTPGLATSLILLPLALLVASRLIVTPLAAR